MRSFFKKPSWASSGEEGADSEFYRRADQTYKDIVAAAKIARERPSISAESNLYKRRRISNEQPQRDLSPEKYDTGCLVIDDQDDIHKSPNSPSITSASIYQDVNDNNSLLSYNVPKPDDLISTHIKPLNPEPRALLDTRKTSDAQDQLRSMKPINVEADNTPGTFHPQSTHPESGRAKLYAKLESAHDNLTVQILITSEIQNTKPLIVHRKISQSLKDVRLAWCNRQNLPQELHSSVFLTWKGRRLFDVTTCKSLGLDRKQGTDSNLKSFNYFDGDTDGIRIHMEAVTEEPLFLEKQSQGPNELDLPLTPSKSRQHQVSISIVLNCPGYVEFRMKASLDMQILQVIDTFRDARHVSREQEIYLVFDGDHLDHQSCLADYDITDDDLIDVVIKQKK